MASRILSLPNSSYKINGNSYQFPLNNNNANNKQTNNNNSSADSAVTVNSYHHKTTSSSLMAVVSNQNTSPISSTSSSSSISIASTASSTSSTSTTTNTACRNLTSNSFKWTIGLMNSDGKYLTAENFGHKINATGNTLRKKQKWQLEQHQNPNGVSSIEDNNAGDEFVVYLLSPLGFYMSTDKYGKLSCDKTEKDESCKFYLETNTLDGKCSFKSVLFGYYFGGEADRLHCFSKHVEWWTIHLAIHPQINLRHALRKRYARMEDDEIYVDELIPWGSDCLITIEFRDEKYAIRTSNGMYLNKDGKLVMMPNLGTLYNIELHRGCVAFRVSK
jgi:hypothetical protein